MYDIYKQSEKYGLGLPRTLNDAKEIGKILSMQLNHHFKEIVLAWMSVYIM